LLIFSFSHKLCFLYKNIHNKTIVNILAKKINLKKHFQSQFKIKLLLYYMTDLDVNSLLNALENETNASIMRLNSNKIKEIKNNMLQKLQLNKDELKKLHKKLNHYRYCSDISDLQYGYYIRWISLKNPENIKLTNGALIVDILISNNCVQILCKNNRNRIFQIKFDECIIFQKISEQEFIILQVLDHLEK